MSCRVARSSPAHPRMDLVCCCQCGSADLEVCATSTTLGPHLCLVCALSKLEAGTANERGTSAAHREIANVS